MEISKYSTRKLLRNNIIYKLYIKNITMVSFTKFVSYHYVSKWIVKEIFLQNLVVNVNMMDNYSCFLKKYINDASKLPVAHPERAGLSAMVAGSTSPRQNAFFEYLTYSLR